PARPGTRASRRASVARQPSASTSGSSSGANQPQAEQRRDLVAGGGLEPDRQLGLAARERRRQRVLAVVEARLAVERDALLRGALGRDHALQTAGAAG